MIIDGGLYEILNDHANKQGNKTAFIELLEGEEVKRINYFDLAVKVRRLAAFFKLHQLSGKECILFFSAGVDAVATILACLISGVIPIIKTVNKNMDKERFNFQLDQLVQTLPGIAAVVSTQDVFSRFNSKSLQKIPNIVIDAVDSLVISGGFIEALKDEDVAMIQLTSGSTGLPKALKITNGNLLYNLFYCANAWDCDLNTKIVTWAPHSHVFGLITGLLLPFYVGGSSIIMQPNDFSKDPLSWIEMISKYEATHSGAPDFAYMNCVAHYSESRMKHCTLKSWTIATSGGEMSKEETLNSFYQTFQKHGFDFNSYCPSYGMTENSGIVCSITKRDVLKAVVPECFDSRRKIISVGTPLHETKIIIADPIHLSLLPEEQIGEILIYSPSLCKSYNHDSKTNDFCKIGIGDKVFDFFRTGDVGFMRDDELYITGRLKEVIIVKGKNYSPHDIENFILKSLNNHMLGKNAAFSIRNVKGEELAILYQEILGSVQQSQQDALKLEIKKLIKHYFGLDIFEVMMLKENTIPMTISNKVQRLKCKEHYMALLKESMPSFI